MISYMLHDVYSNIILCGRAFREESKVYVTRGKLFERAWFMWISNSLSSLSWMVWRFVLLRAFTKYPNLEGVDRDGAVLWLGLETLSESSHVVGCICSKFLFSWNRFCTSWPKYRPYGTNCIVLPSDIHIPMHIILYTIPSHHHHPFCPAPFPPIFPSPCCLPRNLNQVNDVDYIIAGDRIVTVDGAFLPPGEIVAWWQGCWGDVLVKCQQGLPCSCW